MPLQAVARRCASDHFVSLAGDMVGLRSILLRTADHSFSALTDAAVNPVEGPHIVRCMTEFPRLGAALSGLPRATKPWWLSAWSASAGAMAWSAPPISLWSWRNG